MRRFRAFAALDEEALERSWAFRDKAMSVRYALYRTIEDTQDALVTGPRRSPTPNRCASSRSHSARSVTCTDF